MTTQVLSIDSIWPRPSCQSGRGLETDIYLDLSYTLVLASKSYTVRRPFPSRKYFLSIQKPSVFVFSSSVDKQIFFLLYYLRFSDTTVSLTDFSLLFFSFLQKQSVTMVATLKFSFITLLILLALTYALPSMPAVTPPPSLERSEDHRYHAINARQAGARGPKRLTITIENKMNEPLSTSYATNPNAPTLVRGDEKPGTMAASATTSIVVQSGWAGNIAMGLAEYDMTGDASLIEGSLMKQMHKRYLSVDIDVSYV